VSADSKIQNTTNNANKWAQALTFACTAVLLTADLRAKIADVGMALMLRNDYLSVQPSRMGTFTWTVRILMEQLISHTYVRNKYLSVQPSRMGTFRV